MARPKKEDALGANAYIGIRIPMATRATLEAMAAASGRTLADEVRAALDRHANGKGKSATTSAALAKPTTTY